MQAVAIAHTPIGALQLIAEAEGLTRLAVVSEAGLGPIGFSRIQVERSRSASVADTDSERWLDCAIDALRAYFSGEGLQPTVPLQRSGTPFQRAVWEALQRIPAAQPATYAQVAAEIGLPRAARAVGAACGRNRVLLFVPCHRVVAANGMGGFRGGIAVKRWLLAFERAYYGIQAG